MTALLHDMPHAITHVTRNSPPVNPNMGGLYVGCGVVVSCILPLSIKQHTNQAYYIQPCTTAAMSLVRSEYMQSTVRVVVLYCGECVRCLWGGWRAVSRHCVLGVRTHVEYCKSFHGSTSFMRNHLLLYCNQQISYLPCRFLLLWGLTHSI